MFLNTCLKQFDRRSFLQTFPPLPVLARFLSVSLLLVGITFPAPTASAASLEEFPKARLKVLDKITARTKTFEIKVDETIEYGPLYITLRTCRKSPPIEPPRTVAFLEINEQSTQRKDKRVFSGWMFASSPALSSMDHPVYDVWVIDCIRAEGKTTQTNLQTQGPNDNKDPSSAPEDTREKAENNKQTQETAEQMNPKIETGSPEAEDAETESPKTEEAEAEDAAESDRTIEQVLEDMRRGGNNDSDTNSGNNAPAHQKNKTDTNTTEDNASSLVPSPDELQGSGRGPDRGSNQTQTQTQTQGRKDTENDEYDLPSDDTSPNGPDNREFDVEQLFD